MLVIPAIDLLDGRVVRLEQGSYQKVKVYSESPVEAAKRWEECGAELIHVVDLDGARYGKPKNLKKVEEILNSIKIDIEFGGGIRNKDTVEEIFNIGISKIILGTAAINERHFAQGLIAKYGSDKIIFSLDARSNNVFTKGWELNSGYNLKDLLKIFELSGLKHIIYTDILKDGTLSGPNIEGIRKILNSTNLDLIASGGISSIDDIKMLKELEAEGLKGVIIGKALYEGKIDLKEAIQIA